MQTNILQKDVYPTTANYPGTLLLDAVTFAFKKEKSQKLNKKIIQLCPQQVGQLTEFVAEKLKNKFSETAFQLHANVQILNKRFIFDASSNIEDQDVCEYIKQLKLINDILGKNVYSYHAGRKVCSLEKMYDNAMYLQDYLGVEVILEGLYPDNKNTWLVSNVDDYEWLSNKMSFVLDLSHLQIVYEQERKDIDLTWVKELMQHKNCREIHISSNDGTHDSHQIISGQEWWIDLLKNMEIKANIFTEENFK